MDSTVILVRSLEKKYEVQLRRERERGEGVAELWIHKTIMDLLLSKCLENLPGKNST